jgi:hypothetical protein
LFPASDKVSGENDPLSRINNSNRGQITNAGKAVIWPAAVLRNNLWKKETEKGIIV